MVLPAPFGPTSATRCPGDSASETSRSTSRPASVTLTPVRDQNGGVAHATPPAERAALAHDQIEEERHADDRRQHADLDVSGRGNQPHRDVGRQQQRGARQRARHQQPRRIVADQRPHQMRRDQADEADAAD